MLRAAWFALALGAFSVAAFASPPTGEPWLPTPADIQRVEAKVTLPQGASPITAYVRYYAGTTKAGRQIIRGVYLVTAVVRDMKQDARPGVRIVTERDIPEIEDGGLPSGERRVRRRHRHGHAHPLQRAGVRWQCTRRPLWTDTRP